MLLPLLPGVCGAEEVLRHVSPRQRGGKQRRRSTRPPCPSPPPPPPPLPQDVRASKLRMKEGSPPSHSHSGCRSEDKDAGWRSMWGTCRWCSLSRPQPPPSMATWRYWAAQSSELQHWCRPPSRKVMFWGCLKTRVFNSGRGGAARLQQSDYISAEGLLSASTREIESMPMWVCACLQ